MRKSIKLRNETYDYRELLRNILSVVFLPINIIENNDSIIVSYNNGCITVYKQLQEIQEEA